MPDGKLLLSVVDVYGETVQEPVDVFLRNQTLSDHPVLRSLKPAKRISIAGLNRFPNGLYRVEIAAPSYLAVSQFVNIPPSGSYGLLVTLPVNKDRIVSVDFPPFDRLTQQAQRLLKATTIGNLSGMPLYSSWDDARKAGFLNLVAKAERTLLLNHRTVITYLDRISKQFGDRLFALVQPDLHDEIAHGVSDGRFHLVPDTLHTPLEGFHLVDSYKTPERYGNLQLTFSRDPANWAVDMDIDDAQGFEHLFQIVRNAVTGLPTNPYNIHEILLKYQELDPGYRFNLRQPAMAGLASGSNT